MANLKVDLLTKLTEDKMYDELELVRLAQDPNCNYRDKIEQMSYRLASIATLNAQIGLVNGVYFQEPVAPPVVQQAPANAPAPNAPQGVVHPGQTHGE